MTTRTVNFMDHKTNEELELAYNDVENEFIIQISHCGSVLGVSFDEKSFKKFIEDCKYMLENNKDE